LPAPDDHPDEAAANRLLDAESLTQDAALTQEFSAASRHNLLKNKGVASSLTHLPQDSSILTPKDVRRDMVVEQGDGEEVGDSCVKVRQGDLNGSADKGLCLDAATNACVKAASRRSACVKFWSGDKGVMKACPEVTTKVMGYYPFKRVYHLLLADAQVPQALHERLYSPAGMPGQARIEVAAEEIVLCE